MKFSQCFGLLMASSAIAMPVAELESRSAEQITDADILNFALTLEHLENAFYMEGISKFGKKVFEKAGFVPRVRPNVKEIGADESEHVTFLTAVLESQNYTAVKACKYKFPMKTVEDFLAIAQVLEGVGVSAYSGAAALIQNKDYLTAAAEILTVEARHNAYIRDNQPRPQSPYPAAFDVPLTANQVFTLASEFIVSCPKNNPKLPIKANPALAVVNEKPNYKLGSKAELAVAKALDPKMTYHAAFMLVTGPVFVKTTVLKGGKNIEINIPKNKLVAGQAYVVLSTSGKEVTDDNTVAGPAIINILPPYQVGGLPK